MAKKAKRSPISLRAYAKRRGVSAESVSKAVSDGRLKGSVVRVNGAPKIADPDLADREWEANTRQRVDYRAPAGGTPPLAVDESSAMATNSEAEELANYYVSRARREAAAARREGALADLAEMDVLERRGDLIPAADARAQVIDRYTVVKTKILGVPSRVAQRLPHVARADVAVIEDLLREALIELASDDARSDTGST
jgi:hypothetical protein